MKSDDPRVAGSFLRSCAHLSQSSDRNILQILCSMPVLCLFAAQTRQMQGVCKSNIPKRNVKGPFLKVQNRFYRGRSVCESLQRLHLLYMDCFYSFLYIGLLIYEEQHILCTFYLEVDNRKQSRKEKRQDWECFSKPNLLAWIAALSLSRLPGGCVCRV